MKEIQYGSHVAFEQCCKNLAYWHKAAPLPHDRKWMFYPAYRGFYLYPNTDFNPKLHKIVPPKI